MSLLIYTYKGINLSEIYKYQLSNNVYKYKNLAINQETYKLLQIWVSLTAINTETLPMGCQYSTGSP